MTLSNVTGRAGHRPPYRAPGADASAGSHGIGYRDRVRYHHAFHAGNHGDVLKHVVLLAILDLLRRKPAPMFVLDTHAGAGQYDLDSAEATRSGEAGSGIGRLPAGGPFLPALAEYVAAVGAHNSDGPLRTYPGSPHLIARRLRAGDRLVCCELADEAVAALRGLFAGDPRVEVCQGDGYDALKARLPPRHGELRYARGLVLIDPPYEAQEAEFDRIVPALTERLRRWPQGVFALWYPIKLRHTLARPLRRLSALPAKAMLRAELLVRRADSPLRLNGSGMLVFNPPWGLEPMLAEVLPVLGRLLGEPRGDWTLDWPRRPR